VSATELTTLITKNEWKDFEFDIFKRRGSEDGIQEIREILQRHPDGTALARSKDTSGRTPLHAAAQRGDIDLARVLIDDYHVNVNAQDSRRHTVLDLAVMGRHRDFVALLLEQRVNEDAISPQNKKRFREIKGTLLHERRVREKTRAISRSEQSELVT
jgi:ankyrin repeat protein